jgi:hypothetical protein
MGMVSLIAVKITMLETRPVGPVKWICCYHGASPRHLLLYLPQSTTICRNLPCPAHFSISYKQIPPGLPPRPAPPIGREMAPGILPTRPLLCAGPDPPPCRGFQTPQCCNPLNVAPPQCCTPFNVTPS